MKQMRFGMRVVAILLVTSFVGLAVYFGFTVYSQGSRWLANQYNPRLNTQKKNYAMGDISDRNGVLLATTDEDGARHYAADQATRRALSQTVGDQLSMSGTGVETFHAGTLLGFSGSIIDRTWQYLTGATYRGDNIRLTVDAELTTYISQKWSDDYEGAVVVLNYQTGEILAMVSKPDYDPEKVLNRQSSAAAETGSGYLNRCLQGQYTPGSIFKVVTLAAALESLPDVTGRAFTCLSSYPFGDGVVTCYGGTAHGEMSLKQAFGKSCNVTFAALAVEMGAKTLVEKAKVLGFNENFNFRDVVLYESSIPEEIDNVSELAWTGVGQGKLQVTPLHMALIAGAVANGGDMRVPQLIGQVTGVGNIPRLRTASGSYGRVLRADIAAAIGQYMQKSVESGTSKNAALEGYTVCGKTGTAETSDDKTVPTDAWFIGYVKDDAHPYAIAVIIEKGGTGGDKAASLAANVLKRAIALNV